MFYNEPSQCLLNLRDRVQMEAFTFIHSFISKLTVTKRYKSYVEGGFGLSQRNAYSESSTRRPRQQRELHTLQHMPTSGHQAQARESEREASYHVHKTSVTACPRALSTITAAYICTCTCTCILVHRRDFCVHQSLQRSKGGFSCKAAQALLATEHKVLIRFMDTHRSTM